jgi:hypothetical protein
LSAHVRGHDVSKDFEAICRRLVNTSALSVKLILIEHDSSRCHSPAAAVMFQMKHGLLGLLAEHRATQ